MNPFEIIKESLNSVFSNSLRTVLTALIIAIGITALVGILTSIEAISGNLNKNFSLMGSNSFTIQNKGTGFRMGFRGHKAKQFTPIRYAEAVEFKNTFEAPVTVGITSNASNSATVKYNNLKTDPNIEVVGGDESYLSTNGYTLRDGRNFSKLELENGDNVVIIGQEIANKLFKTNPPLNETISIGNSPFRVIGIFNKKGSSAALGGDKICLIPVMKSRSLTSTGTPSFLISIQVRDANQLKTMVSEATGWFRNIRLQPVGEEDSFDITTSDALANQLLGNLSIIKLSATAIGFITLLGASIALMNIMLVSVTERTREIGIRKAIGATPQVIRRQFLMEALVICQMGGVAGVIFGILIGNMISLVTGGGFIVPWLWMFGGLAICVLVGLASGFYPAQRASKLDPVESLRYE
jgi:putative ABC transport system permease protein